MKPNIEWRAPRWVPLLLALAGTAAPMVVPDVAQADVRTEARTHFRRGMQLIQDNQLEAGITELEEAYRILPHPNVLFNIARAYAAASRTDEAIAYFERYLETDPSDRSEVEAQLTQLRATRDAAAALPTPEAPSEPQESLAPVATEEEIAALEESAQQIDLLAAAASSDALRDRAERLRALATSLRERRVQASPPTPEESEAIPVETPAEMPVEAPPPVEAPQPPAEVRPQTTYEESVVSSARAAQSPLDAPNSTTIVTAQDIRMSGVQEPAFALRRVAGVSILHTDPGNPQINIRGLNQRLSNRTVVLIDGRSAYLDFLGTTLWNFLPYNAEDIERIEVIRGPASALYGADAFSGIINVITRNPGDAPNYVSAGIGNQGQYRLVAGASARVERFRFRVSGGYTRADQYALEVGPSRVDLHPSSADPNLGAQRLQANGEAIVRLDGGTSIRFGGGISEGQFAFQGLSRLRQLWGSEGFLSQAHIALETDVGLTARAYWNRFSILTQNQATAPGGIALAQEHRVQQDVLDTEVVYRNSFNVEGIGNAIIGGIGYRFKAIEWPWIEDGAQTQHHGSLFLQDTLSFSDVVQIVLSVRGDLHPLVGPQVSPRGSLVVHPTEGQTIRLAGGAAFRSPTFVESYIQVPNQTPLRGVTALGLGNTSLSPERIISVELGYMNAMSEFFSLELNGYFNVVYDFITLSQSQNYRLWDVNGGNPNAQYSERDQAFAVQQLRFNNEVGSFRQIGGELAARAYPIDGLDLYANYAIHETAPLSGTVASSAFARDARTSAHMVNAGVQYRAPFGLNVSVDFSWQSAQTWSEQDVDPSSNQVVFTLVTIPDYVTLNARVGWSLFDDHLELSVVGTNLVADGHREHPYGQPVDRRLFGNLAVRF